MGLTTLARVKTQLGIASTDTSKDAQLTQWLGDAIAIVRAETGRWLGGQISACTAANPTSCTSINHGLETGDVVAFAHSGGMSPSLDLATSGLLTVTRVDENTFTVPVNVASITATQTAIYARQSIEFYSGDGTQILILQNRPVWSIAAIYEDSQAYWGDQAGAFAAATLLTEGTDFALVRDTNTNDVEQSRRGFVQRLGTYWPPGRLKNLGLLSNSVVGGRGNVKAQYTYGYCPIPNDLQEAVAGIVSLIRLSAKFGRPLSGETITFYSYTLADVKGVASEVTSITRILSRYRGPRYG